MYNVWLDIFTRLLDRSCTRIGPSMTSTLSENGCFKLDHLTATPSAHLRYNPLPPPTTSAGEYHQTPSLATHQPVSGTNNFPPPARNRQPVSRPSRQVPHATAPRPTHRQPHGTDGTHARMGWITRNDHPPDHPGRIHVVQSPGWAELRWVGLHTYLYPYRPPHLDSTAG